MKELIQKIGEVPNWKLTDQMEYFKKLGLNPRITYVKGKESVIISQDDTLRLFDIRIKYTTSPEELKRLINHRENVRIQLM